MKGSYKGEVFLQGCTDDLFFDISNNAKRLDCIHHKDLNDFSEIGESNLIMLFSVYENNENIEYYGDYSAYSKVLNLMNSVEYYYFTKEEIVVSETIYDANGVVHNYKAVSKDGRMEYRKVRHNGEITFLYYRCGEDFVSLSQVADNVSVRKRGRLDYTKLEVESEVSDCVASTYRSLNEIGEKKDLSWLESRKDTYIVVNTPELFKKFVRDIYKAWKRGLPIAFDTETTGVIFNRFPVGTPGRDELVGLCISWVQGAGYYIPVGHISVENIELEWVIGELKEVLENAYIVTHYGKFDANVMRTYGIDLNIQEDTYLIQYILSNVDAFKNLKLKWMTKNYLGIDQIGLDDIFPGSDDGDTVKFQILPFEHVKYYACADADFTLQLYYLLRNRIPYSSQSLYKHEVYFMRVLSETEYYGNAVDIDNMLIEESKCVQDIAVLEKEIYNLAGYTFNISSPPMLSNLLYDEMKCEVVIRTNTNSPSTGVTALKNLAGKASDKPNPNYPDIVSTYTNKDGKPHVILEGKDLGKLKYPIIQILLEYKRLIKLSTTFFAGLKRDNNGGYIFSSYNQTRAATGRTISNFQQIPKDLKHLIREWSDDYYMINLDYISIELKVMAGVAGQEDVIEMFTDPEVDPHRVIGSKILHKPPEDISGKERKRMKIANFGVPFDMGPTSLASFLEGYPVTKESRERARILKADYLNSMPKVKRMFESVRNKAQREGYVSTIFGRIGVFKNLVNETDDGLISRGRRQAGNLPIQGTAADILKIATGRLHRKIKELGLEVYITGNIHDELILVVNRNVHPYLMIQLIKECMELKIEGFPPIYTGIAVSSNWGEGKTQDIRELPVLLAERMAQCSRDGIYPEFDCHPKDFILDECREYLMGRFKDYFVELGLNLVNPEESNFHDLVVNFKHMFLGPRIVAYYTNLETDEEPKTPDAIAMGLADVLGWELDKVKAKIEADTPEEADSSDTASVEFDVIDQALHYANFGSEASGSGVSAFMIDEMYDIDEETDVGDSMDDIELDETLHANTQDISDTLKIFTTYDDIIVNVDGCTKANLANLREYFTSINLSNGIYSIKYLFNDEIIPTPFRVDKVDRDKIMEIIKEEYLVI